MGIRFQKPAVADRRAVPTSETRASETRASETQATEKKPAADSSPEAEALTGGNASTQGGEVSPEMKVAIGDTAPGKAPRKRSAGSRGALAGLKKAASDDEQAKSGTKGWKKAVLAAMIGITMVNALAPSVASAQEAFSVVEPTQMEQVLDAKDVGYTNPLMLQMMEKSDGTLELPASAFQAGGALQGGANALGDGVGNGPGDGPGDAASSDGLAKPLTDGSDNVRLADLDLDLSLGSTSNIDPGVQTVVEQAGDQLGTRLSDILNLDASSLAEGQTPWRNGDALTDGQQSQLQDAFGDFFKDLPAGALSDGVTGPLKAALEAGGVDVSNFAQTPIGDLGDFGSELAENLLEKFKDDHPAAFYATAGALAAGVGYYGYAEGSEALRDIGIKPEVSTDLFNDRVELKLGADWESKFENLSGSLDAEVSLNGGHTVGAGFGYDGEDFSPRLSYGFDGEQWDLSLKGEMNVGTGDVDANGTLRWQPNSDLGLNLQGNLDADGADHLQLNARRTFDNGSTLDLGVRNVWDNDNDHTDVTARWKLSQDDLSVSAGASYRFGANDGFGADLSVGYQPADNMDIQLRGGLNTDGDAQVGVGFTWRF